ncbi:MAG: DUF4340 domain-containing protein [Spirochaetia bacterium]|nr:DUF4340 domain-containing protein [Spirochaetia bacterium]
MPDFKNINIRLLTINLVVLIIAFLVNDPAHLFESTYAQSPRLLKFRTQSEISEITINAPGNPQLILKKSESGWSVQTSGQDKDYPADNRIEKALETLMDLHKYYEVTSNEKKYAEYEINDDALMVELKGSGKTEQLLIGKPGSGFNTSLARIKGEKTVYSVKGNLKSDWNQNMDYFRNKRLFQFSRENIQSISVQGPVWYTLKNSDDKKWLLTSGNMEVEANLIRTDRLLDDICLMEGSEFNNSGQTGFVYGSIKVELKSNTGFTLSINRNGNDYLVKSEFNPYWQKISEYRIKALFPPMDELKAKPGQ